MPRGREKPLQQIGDPAARHDEKPRDAGTEKPSREVAEPDAGAQVGREVWTAQVQGERRPCAPPLTALYARGIELAGVECIEADQPVGNDICHPEQPRRIRCTSYPGVAMERRWWRRLRRAVLGLVLSQLTHCPMSVRLRYFQGEPIAARHDLAGDAHRAQHEDAVLAVPAPEGAVDLDAGVNQRIVRLR